VLKQLKNASVTINCNIFYVKIQFMAYVSRGGIKLEHALREFEIKVKGRVALDVGAATGGFTDCLLQQGADRVYAVDVGYGILAWSLRQDPRVKVLERSNARHLTLRDMGLETPNINLATIDASFISLSKILPAVYNLLTDKAEVIALIKPQFEARREQVERGGVVKDEAVRQEVIEKIKVAAQEIGFKVGGVTPSPLKGPAGNVEYFIHLHKRKD
jgi:23S rRNA (cytidine1920-2'-O)/16S rRNA (cytidine1409-2'-O)-methyltransferase